MTFELYETKNLDEISNQDLIAHAEVELLELAAA